MSSYRAIDSTLPSSELERTECQLGESARLNPRHRTILKQQGLSDREIDGIGFVSLERLSEIDKNWSTSKNPGDLFGSTDGVIGIPCYGKNGQIHGYQIWSDESDAAVAGKFFWPPGKLPNRLSNGEPPLNYARPEQLQDSTIALCSGILKSHLVARQLGRIAIGAEGGLFHRCPRQMKRFLGQLRGQLVIYPDPGELLDPQAMQRWREQVNFIGKRLRRKVVFAWWGQIRPEDGELVELEPEKVDKITYLTPEEFWLLANQCQRQAKIKQIQQSMRSLGECQPHSRFNERYLPSLSEQLPRSGIVALKSPKGTGKSVQIANIIRSWRTHRRGIVFSTTPRRALGREQSRRWGLTWAGDGDVSLKGLKAFSLCLDSLWKVEKIDFRRALIVIDEVELALMHLLLSSTCRERRSQLLRVLELKLTECLNSGGLLLIADADLTDLAIGYFRALIPKAPLFLIENDCQSPQNRWQVDFHTGKKDPLLANLLADLAFPVEEQGERRQRRIAIATDSKDEAEALRRTIAQQFPDLPMVTIHSGTTETEQGREFVEHPNEKLAELQPAVLIYTPSMGAGVSLDLPWFDVVYGFFVGVLEPSQCRQMLGRIRPPVPRRLWCRQRGMLEGNTSFEPEAIKSRLMNFHKQTNILLDVAKAIAGEDASDAQLLRVQSQLWDRDQQTWQNVHLDLFAKLVARQNYSLYHLAALFESELAAEGHIVLPFQDKARNQDGFNHRITKQKLAVEEADKIARAEEISYPEALRLKERPLSTEQQRYQVTKALLKAELPGLELTSEFLYQTITRDRRRTLNAFKLGWYLDHPDRTREKDCREWLIHLSRWAMNDLVYLPDLRTHSYQIEVILQLGLFEIIALNDLGREYSTPCLEKLKQKALLLKERLKIAFNLTVTSKTAPMRLVQNLLGRVGLKLKKSRQTTDGTRYYRLDEELVNDKHRLAVRASLDRKWMETESYAGDWAEPANRNQQFP